MKKILTVLLALLTMAVLATTVAAEDPATLKVSFGEAVYNEDGTVTMDLIIDENPGFCVFGCYLEYDENVITGWTVEDADDGLDLTSAYGLIFNKSGNFTGKGTIATITFTLVENAPHGNLVVTLLDGVNFEGTPNRDCVNYDEETVAVEVADGTIAIAHDIVHVEAVEATCENEGNVEYWYCKDEACGLVWEDEALTIVSNHKNVKRGVKEHTVVAMDAVAPRCHHTGNVAYWFCSVCNAVWVDEECTQVSNRLSVILPELGGDVIHVEAKAATKEEEGVKEHWYCEECEQVWEDEARTQLSNHKNVIIPKLPEFEPADVNGDGAVDVLDYMLVKRHVLGTYTMTEEQIARADLDGNGEIEGLDYMTVKRAVLGTWPVVEDEPDAGEGENTENTEGENTDASDAE